LDDRSRADASGAHDAMAARSLKSQDVTPAVLAAIVVFGISLLLLGLPGAVILEAALALGFGTTLKGDDAWPLAIFISFVGSALIVPMSLALRHKFPHIVGWAHVRYTGLLAVAGAFIFALIALR
jgi:hypothetical protein